jgi:hypothetical protein
LIGPDLSVRKLLIGTALLLAAMLSLQGCGPSYTCTDASGHCYGVVQVSPPDLNGVTTSYNAVSLNGGDGHINNEIWLVQQNNSSCSNFGNQCWVEIGILAATAGQGCQSGVNPVGIRIFWADNRPNQGYICHDMGQLQTQEIGQPVFALIGIHPGSPNTFDAELLTCTSETGNGNCPRRVFSGTSSNNTMVPTAWDIGLELEGTTGASAPQTQYFDNIVTSPSSPIGWGWLMTDGTSIIQTPVNAGWTTPPSTSPENSSWFSSCCN